MMKTQIPLPVNTETGTESTEHQNETTTCFQPSHLPSRSKLYHYKYISSDSRILILNLLFPALHSHSPTRLIPFFCFGTIPEPVPPVLLSMLEHVRLHFVPYSSAFLPLFLSQWINTIHWSVHLCIYSSICSSIHPSNQPFIFHLSLPLVWYCLIRFVLFYLFLFCLFVLLGDMLNGFVTLLRLVCFIWFFYRLFLSSQFGLNDEYSMVSFLNCMVANDQTAEIKVNANIIVIQRTIWYRAKPLLSGKV